MIFRVLPLLLFLGFASLLGPARAGAGSVFVVDSTADSVDANLGDGVCADAQGRCTLRAAVMEANASVGAATITFGRTIDTLPITLTIPPSSTNDAATGDLNITGAVTIRGNGASNTIIQACDRDGDPFSSSACVGIDRVFNVAPGANVMLTDLKVRNGAASGGPGAAPAHGAGILNTGVLTIKNSVIAGNIADNRAPAFGGGIYTNGTLVLINSTIRANSSIQGGGIWAEGGIVRVTRSTVTGNGANGSFGIGAGGLLLSPGTTTTITNSTISDNGAGFGDGGGLLNQGALTIRGSTISGNIAQAGNGGGIANDCNTGTMKMINSTVAGNTAHSNQAGGAGTGGGIISGCAVIINSTVASNLPTGISGAHNFLRGVLLVNNGRNCETGGFGTNDGGYNLSSDGECLLGDPTSRSDVNFSVGPLQDNGGFSQTMALPSGSPAIDAIPAAACLDVDHRALLTDQRGFSRPTNGTCDIGAFEFGSRVQQVRPSSGGDTGPVTITVTVQDADFTDGTAVKLTRSGLPDLVPTQVGVLSDSAVSATFDLTGRANGAWDAVVANPDGKSFSFPGSFTIEPGRRSRISVDIIGRTSILQGRPQIFTIVVGNSGNVDVMGVPTIRGIPANAIWHLDTPPPPVVNGSAIEWNQILQPIPLVDGLALILPPVLVPPGVTTAARLRFTLPIVVPHSTFELRSTWTEP